MRANINFTFSFIPVHVPLSRLVCHSFFLSWQHLLPTQDSLYLHDCQVTVTVASAVSGGWCWPSLRCYVMPSSEPPWLLAAAEQRAAEPEPGGYLCCSPSTIRPHSNMLSYYVQIWYDLSYPYHCSYI